MNTSVCVRLVTLRLLGIVRRDKVMGRRGENVTIVVATIAQYATTLGCGYAPAIGGVRGAGITTKQKLNS